MMGDLIIVDDGCYLSTMFFNSGEVFGEEKGRISGEI
jgi:hypothetical protein